MEWRGGEGREGQGRVPDCLGGLSRVGISSRPTRPWNGQPPSYSLILCVVGISWWSANWMERVCMGDVINIVYGILR